MTAEEIMTPAPTTVDVQTTLDDALRLMSEKEIRHLPVIRNAEVVGMISDRDLRGLGLSLVHDAAALDTVRARLRMRVADVMSSDVASVGPATEVSEVIDLLLEEKISAVTVVDEEKNVLMGIVSYVDVLRAVQPVLD